MKLAMLVLLLLAALALYCLICRCSGREKFFGGLDTFTVRWVAPDYVNPSALTYQWIICPASAPGITQSDPTTWPISGSVPQTTSSTSAIVTSTACPTCDFGMPLLFAVQAQDNTVSPASVSTWSIQQIDLSGSLTGAISIVDGGTGSVLSTGSGSFAIAFTPSAAAPSTATTQAFVNVYDSNGNATYATIALNLPSQADGYFSDPNIWQPINSTTTGQPGPLALGDVVTTTVLVSDSTTVYYYGNITMTVGNAGVSAPTGITWTIA